MDNPPYSENNVEIFGESSKANGLFSVEGFKNLSFILFLMFVFLFQLSIATSITEFTFYLPLFIIVALFLVRRSPIYGFSPLIYPLFLFGVWAFVTLFFALDKPYSIHDYLAHFIKYIALYILVINLITNKKRIKIFSWVFIISSSAFCMGAIIYEFIILNESPFIRFGLNLVQTPTNLIGVFSLFAIILAFGLTINNATRLQKYTLIFLILPIIIVIVLSQTRSNFVAIFFVILVIFYNRKKIAAAMVLSLIIILIVSPARKHLTTEGSIHHRLSLIRISIEIIKDYPLFGIGFGIDTIVNHKLIPPKVYNAKVPKKYRLSDEYFIWPHNMFLSVAERTGLIGAVLFGSVIFMCFLLLIKLVRSGREVFIKKWSLCILASLVMFVVKGDIAPIFSTTPETVFYLILSLTAVLWRMNYYKANNETINL